MSTHQSKVLGSIMACRTSDLGVSLQTVCKCGHEVVAYNSCRDRHCPNCEARATRRWMSTQCENLLPVVYHHCVFTIPDILGTLVRYNEAKLYSLLFGASSGCLKSFFANDNRFGGQGGFMGILHTWGQRLQYHPHVHFLVACGSISDDGSWKASDGYLFDVKNLSHVFRGRYLHGIEELLEKDELNLPPGWGASSVRNNLRAASRRPWVVYTKKPACGVAKLVEYIGRYARKVAISEGRILRVDESGVAYRWKDYRNSKRKITALSGPNFVKFFVQHILPFGFKRIRYYGFWRPSGLTMAREAIRKRCDQLTTALSSLRAAAEQLISSHNDHGRRCPSCGDLLFPVSAPAFGAWNLSTDTS